MTTPAPLMRACADACDIITDIGAPDSWQVRMLAAQLLIHDLTGITPQILPVRAVAYGRSAVHRLGGALMPRTDAELAHFREQAGPAMTPLGQHGIHAVLVIDELIIELATSNDHHGSGVILTPFAAPLSRGRPALWTIDGLRFGVTVIYEHLPEAVLSPMSAADEASAHQLFMFARATSHDLAVDRVHEGR